MESTNGRVEQQQSPEGPAQRRGQAGAQELLERRLSRAECGERHGRMAARAEARRGRKEPEPGLGLGWLGERRARQPGRAEPRRWTEMSECGARGRMYSTLPSDGRADQTRSTTDTYGLSSRKRAGETGAVLSQHTRQRQSPQRVRAQALLEAVRRCQLASRNPNPACTMLKTDDPLATLDLTHLKPLPSWREKPAENIAFIFDEPEDWPNEVPFLKIPRPSPLLPLADRIRYCSPPLATPPNAPPPVVIKRILGRNHPCKMQYGLFNGDREIDKGTWIRDYLGERSCLATTLMGPTRGDPRPDGRADLAGFPVARAPGEIHTDPESEPASDYDVCVLRSQNPLETISIDATLAGNEGR